MDHSKILGTVLAGGKSQRFGDDKSQVKLANKLLIDYILSEIIDEFKELLIISNNPIKFQKSEKITVIKDFKKAEDPSHYQINQLSINSELIDLPQKSSQELLTLLIVEDNYNINNIDILSLEMHLYYYNLHTKVKEKWYHAKLVSIGRLNKSKYSFQTNFFNENLYRDIIKKCGSSIYNLDALKVKYYDYDYDSLE